MHHGHIVFRDPCVLRHIAPSMDFSVFAQNMTNSTVPSHKVFSSSLKRALSATSSSLPEDRAMLHADIASELVSSCASFYNTCAHECSKLIYAPYVQKQRDKLPPSIIPHFMDKAPQVPIFACGHFWRHVHHSTYFMGCSVLGRGAEPPQFWVLLIWLEPGISHVTWVHYDATMCLPCFVCSILPVLHFLRFDLCVL